MAASPELEDANGGVSILALLEVDEVTGEVVEVEVGVDRFRLLLRLFFGLWPFRTFLPKKIIKGELVQEIEWFSEDTTRKQLTQIKFVIILIYLPFMHYLYQYEIKHDKYLSQRREK